ncbi:hypothetical protein KEC58_20800 (plasmid) [Photobacterium damselae]|uniref:hypothetical protein n=1 Tax=Photobacterium damselae TaxID=38293 RepID=UPI002543D8A2
MKHYLLVSYTHNYELVTDNVFDCLQDAMDYGYIEFTKKGLDPYSCENKLTVASINNVQRLECIDGEIVVSCPRKLRSYICSYESNGDWITMPATVIAKSKVLAEMQLANNPSYFGYIHESFNQNWTKTTKWRVKFNTMVTGEILRFPYSRNKDHRLIRYCEPMTGKTITHDR